MSEYKFSKNEKVSFVYGELRGYGEVIGVATTELPILGSFYIVRVFWSDSESLNSHPFNVITIPEINLVSIKTGEYFVRNRYDILVDNITSILEINPKVMANLRSMPTPEQTLFLNAWIADILARLTYDRKDHVEAFLRAMVLGKIFE